MMTALTPRQLQILCLIRSGCNSFQDLANALGYKFNSIGVASWHLTQLKRRRLVTWRDDKSRTLRLTKAGYLAIEGYVLGPGGYVGKWQQVEEMEGVR